MEESLNDIKMTNHFIKRKAINALRDQMHRIKSLQQSNQLDDISSAKQTETRTKDAAIKWSTPDVIKYLSLMIVVWIFFAIYSYLHNRCMLYGGSNCVHMNPFTYQICNSDNNYIF